MTFGTKLQNLRKSKNMSQEDLANILDISRQAISKWELDQSFPDTSNIIRISKLFNVTTDYLLLDNSDIPPTSNSLRPDKTKSYIIILASIFSAAIGFTGMFILYIVSRFVEVPVWLINIYGRRAYYNDYNFFAFIKHFKLYLLVSFFTLLFIVGVSIIVYKYRYPIKKFFTMLYNKVKPVLAKLFKRKNKTQTPPGA